jgi:DNA-binding MarR family transcriptional regulator
MPIATKSHPHDEAGSSTDIAPLLVSFTRSIYRTIRSISSNCPFLEMKTLAILHEQKSPSMKSIAEELGISSPAVTPVIDRLIADKAVERSEDEHDRRMIRISLTPRGKRLFEKNRSVIYDAISRRVESLSPAEKMGLARILAKLQTPGNI